MRISEVYCHGSFRLASIKDVEVETRASIDPARVVAAQGGDVEIRQGLLEETYRSVFRYQVRLTRGDMDRAHDLSHETMVRLLGAFRRLREPDRYLVWVLRIAANVWRDACARHPEVTLDAERLEDPVPPTPGDEDRMARVFGALDALSEPYRSAVALRYLEGLDYEAIAELLGVTPVTLRSHVARGLRMIRERCRS